MQRCTAAFENDPDIESSPHDEVFAFRLLTAVTQIDFLQEKLGDAAGNRFDDCWSAVACDQVKDGIGAPTLLTNFASQQVAASLFERWSFRVICIISAAGPQDRH